ncbi:hemolysin family protein [Nafulsella turpanensis]|uniref:hemolysin family protein n=1 Tax=Nafulsella turpanensis TaxID=1265690 RepID=UPI0003480D5D|nr:hemolysin family protein [Nafulsella turpanensis]
MELQILYIILASIIFSAFFSGIEIAFVSADKLQIELQRKQGDLAGRILSRFVLRPSSFIGTTLIGNTISLVVYGYFMALLLEPPIARMLPHNLNPELADILVLLLQTIVSTLVVLITAEFTPKSVFLLNPNWLLNVFAIPITLIWIIMYPVVWIIISLSEFIIRKVFGLPYSEDKPVFELTDLNNFIQRNVVSQDDRRGDGELVDTKIFNNALEFKTIRVRDCMIPRTDIEAVDVEEDIETLKETFVESGHSKILVYRDSIDDIIGYCHSLELFKKPKDIASILTPIIIVPETMLANELMIQFITEHKSLALVVDEFGGTSGIVSIEDIIEEIFGEIQDEHDVEELIEQQIGPSTFRLSARQEIDYLNDKWGWNLPTGDYDTVGGLLLSVKEDIPEVQEEITIKEYKFTVLSIQGNRIDTVNMEIISGDNS